MRKMDAQVAPQDGRVVIVLRGWCDAVDLATKAAADGRGLRTGGSDQVH